MEQMNINHISTQSLETFCWYFPTVKIQYHLRNKARSPCLHIEPGENRNERLREFESKSELTGDAVDICIIKHDLIGFEESGKRILRFDLASRLWQFWKELKTLVKSILNFTRPHAVTYIYKIIIFRLNVDKNNIRSE